MTPVEPVVGSLRGFRWWRSPATANSSPLARSRPLERGENEATCLARRGMFGWKMSRTPHPRGCPATRCECGFYALHALPSINEESTERSGRSTRRPPAGATASSSGSSPGTAGPRRHPGMAIALRLDHRAYAGPAVGPRRDVQEAAATYDVPLYRNLDAMVSEWGPDRDASPA